MGLRYISFVPISVITLSAIPVTAQPLRDLAETHGIHIGSAVQSGPLNGTYAAVLAREFNAVVAEWEMKFGVAEPSPNNFNFLPGDKIADFAQGNHMAMRGHCLVWHKDQGWAATANGSRDSMLSVLKNHITQMVSHYRGKIFEWDVVNEAINNGTGTFRETFWQQTIGNDYIDSAFVWAHAADTDAVLIYNEYGNEGFGVKTDSVYALVAGLKSRGIPIGGVGMQCHFALGELNVQEMDANIKRIAELGLQVSLTEVDIRMELPADSSKLEQQKQEYKALLGVCLANPNCKTFVTWGYTDALSWVSDYYAGWGAALPFDATFSPKPAYAGLVEALGGTVITGVRKNGKARTRISVFARNAIPFDFLGRRMMFPEGKSRYISLP